MFSRLKDLANVTAAVPATNDVESQAYNKTDNNKNEKKTGVLSRAFEKVKSIVGSLRSSFSNRVMDVIDGRYMDATKLDDAGKPIFYNSNSVFNADDSINHDRPLVVDLGERTINNGLNEPVMTASKKFAMEEGLKGNTVTIDGDGENEFVNVSRRTEDESGKITFESYRVSSNEARRINNARSSRNSIWARAGLGKSDEDFTEYIGSSSNSTRGSNALKIANYRRNVDPDKLFLSQTDDLLKLRSGVSIRFEDLNEAYSDSGRKNSQLRFTLTRRICRSDQEGAMNLVGKYIGNMNKDGVFEKGPLYIDGKASPDVVKKCVSELISYGVSPENIRPVLTDMSALAFNLSNDLGEDDTNVFEQSQTEERPFYSREDLLSIASEYERARLELAQSKANEKILRQQLEEAREGLIEVNQRLDEVERKSDEHKNEIVALSARAAEEKERADILEGQNQQLQFDLDAAELDIEKKERENQRLERIISNTSRGNRLNNDNYPNVGFVDVSSEDSNEESSKKSDFDPKKRGEQDTTRKDINPLGSGE